MSVILATGGYDHKIRFWEAPSGVCTRILQYPDSQLNKLEITPDKQFLAAGGNPHIRIYEVDSSSSGEHQQPVLTLEGHTSSVTSFGFQIDGKYLYSGSDDGTIKLWDLRNPTFSRSLDCKAPVNSVTLRVDRDQIISGDANGIVKVWDLGGNSKDCISQTQPGDAGTLRSSIQAVDISDDSRTLVAVSNHGMAFAWDPTKPQSSINNSGPNSSSFFTPLAKFRAHPIGSYCLHARLAPNCQTLCTTGSDGTVKLWDTTSWKLEQNLQQHTKWVWDAAFCANSSFLVTASSDRTARLWKLDSGEVVRKYLEHQSAVTCVALNDSNV